MPIAKLPPNTIALTGRSRNMIINDIPIRDVLAKPGHIVETFNDTTVTPNVRGWRRHSSATGIPSKFVLLENDIFNKGVDDTFALGNSGAVMCLRVGDAIWGLIPSGQNITQDDPLQSNGDGTFKAATATTAAANVAHYKAQETLGAVTTLTRCRIEVIVG